MKLISEGKWQMTGYFQICFTFRQNLKFKWPEKFIMAVVWVDKLIKLMEGK
jgi:hypothetical protein